MGDLGTAHGDKTFNLRHVCDRHDAGHDGDFNSQFAGAVAKSIEVGIIKKQLCNDEIAAVVNFALEVFEVAHSIQTLRMTLRIARYTDAEIVSPACISHQSVCIGESPFC